MAADTVEINGYALRALRHARRMKQDHVRVIAGISGSYYSELESGKKTSVSRTVLQGLMDAFNLEPYEERALTRWWTVAEADHAEALQAVAL